MGTETVVGWTERVGLIGFWSMRSELMGKYGLAGSIVWLVTLSHGVVDFRILGSGTRPGQGDFLLACVSTFYPNSCALKPMLSFFFFFYKLTFQFRFMLTRPETSPLQ